MPVSRFRLSSWSWRRRSSSARTWPPKLSASASEALALAAASSRLLSSSEISERRSSARRAAVPMKRPWKSGAPNFHCALRWNAPPSRFQPPEGMLIEKSRRSGE
ncbi:MAG: hypothetical protein FD126_2556 [Elusimicrobia bacterium]|nr:MAG: hypothetical protein FD126_2556 [Elusimicrobiota bacterium]